MSQLREWRRKRGLTQEQLADAAGIDQATISTLEIADDPNPTWKTVQRLAKVLNVKAEHLFPSTNEGARA